MLMWRLLVQPTALLDHLKGSKRLLRLIVIVELPWQIADREKHNDNCGDQPECPPAEEAGLAGSVLNHERRSGQVLTEDNEGSEDF
jgi:hypothetical protein